jgi:hypothetical protein
MVLVCRSGEFDNPLSVALSAWHRSLLLHAARILQS